MPTSSSPLPAHARSRLAQRSLLVLVGVAVAVAMAAASAAAHAIVHSTSPQADATVAGPPAEVVMRFNEPVEIAFGAIRVFDGAGRRVDDGAAHYVPGAADAVAVALRPGLADGTYTVSWRVLSADSHPIQEAFVFHVGAPGPQPEGMLSDMLSGESSAGTLAAVLLGVTRWLTYVGLLALLGAAVFHVAVWDRGPARPPAQVEAAFRHRWRRAIVGAWLLLVVTTASSIVLQAAVAGNVPPIDAMTPTMLGSVLDTRFGLVAAARLIVLLGLAVALLATRPRASPRRATPSVGAASQPPRRRPLVLVAGALVALGLAATPGLAGHAATVDPVAVNLAADAVHVVAAGAWTGGLLLLLVAVFPAMVALPRDERAHVLAPVVTRFSNLAMVAVCVLVVTGVYRAWVETGTTSALVDTSYGSALLAKLAVFVPLVVLGGINNRWLRPRLQRAVSDRRDEHVVPLLRRSVATEGVLVIAVLAITAVLVNLPPGRTAAGASGPFTQHVVVGEEDAELIIDPNRVGENTITVMILGQHDHEPAFEALELRLSMPEDGIGPLIASPEPIAPDHHAVRSHHLSVPGAWEIEIVGHIDRFSDVSTTVTVHVQR